MKDQGKITFPICRAEVRSEVELRLGAGAAQRWSGASGTLPTPLAVESAPAVRLKDQGEESRQGGDGHRPGGPQNCSVTKLKLTEKHSGATGDVPGDLDACI